MDNAEQRVKDFLNNIRIDYEVIDIDPNFSDTINFCNKYNLPMANTCNTIIVVGKKAERIYAACVVCANSRLDVNKKVRSLLGAKTSFATADEMTSVTGMVVGGVTPLALPKALPLYVDRKVMEVPWVILGGGGRSIKIRVATSIFALLGAIVEDIVL